MKKFLTARLVAAGSTAVLVGGLAAVAGSANAAGPDSFSCTFSGSTGNSLTPIPQPPAHGTPASTNLSEEGDAAYTTGSTGTYTFTGTGNCTGSVAGQTLANQAITISSSGSYQNIVCGTGEAVSASDGVHGAQADATATPAVITWGAHRAEVYYTIDFSSGQGVLRADVHFDDDGVTIDAAGGVDILPSNTGGCATAPVLGFNVNGSVTGSGSSDTEA